MGTEKRARQKAGTQARRAAAQEAAAKAKRRRTIIRVGIVVVAALGIFLGITLSGGGDDDQQAEPQPPPSADVVAGPAEEEMSEAENSEDTAAGEDGSAGDAGDAADDDGSEPDPAADDTAAGDGAGDTAEPPAVDDQATPDGPGPHYTPYEATNYGSGACAPVGGAAEPVLDFAGQPQNCLDGTTPLTAVFDTTAGVVRVALDVTNTPGTVNSFVNLTRFGYYDGTLIHRSAPSIGIVQGGSPHTNTASDPGPGYTIWDEGTGFTYRPGQLVMARTGAPNSAGGQYFFTITPDAGLLDGQGTYVVFGEVTEGLDVLEAILASHVDQPGNPLGGAPEPAVTVNTLTIEAG